MLSVTSLAWKPDGSKLAVGGLRGSVDVWDTCIRRTRSVAWPVGCLLLAFALAMGGPHSYVAD
jgi:hypothetical protein